MTALPPKAIAALLRQVGIISSEARIILTAIGLAESGGEVELARGTRRGIWQLDDSLRYDARRMVSDAAYAAKAASEVSGVGVDFTPWSSFVSGKHSAFLNAARQGEAQAAAVTGSILDEAGTYIPTYPYPASPLVPEPIKPGHGQPITASFQQDAPLNGLRVTGTDMTSDLASITIGEATYNAGLTEVPNLTFTIADPQGDLLWQARNLWVRGARVEYLDLDLRIDEIKFEPGGHTTGQITITAIDALVYALQGLRGSRVAKGVSPTEFVRQEVRLAGFNPDLYFLGEGLSSQAEIARDVPDQNNASSGGSDPPSGWTTALRLAKETGKRCFISGRKLIFGSAAFAADWASPSEVRIGWHNATEDRRWLTLPTGTQTSVGSRQGVTQVSGRVPLIRARLFRPGVSVIVHNTPSIAAGDRRFICDSISFSLARDVDGAEVELIEPVELQPEKK